MWQWIEARIQVKVFFVSLFRRLFPASLYLSPPPSSHCRRLYIRVGRMCVAYGLPRPCKSLFLCLPLCPLLPILPSLDPANDSWKNNSENERATTVEEWDPGEGKRDGRERGG